MLTNLSARKVFAAIAAICLGVLAFAYWEQHGPNQMQPCPYCILQRYAFIGIAFICLLGAIHGPGRKGARVYAALAGLKGLAGLGMAVYLVLKRSSMTTCLADPVAEFVNGLPTAAWWDEFFWATGGCGTEYPPLLGLSVPAWSLVWFAVLCTVLAAVVFSKKLIKA